MQPRGLRLSERRFGVPVNSEKNFQKPIRGPARDPAKGPVQETVREPARDPDKKPIKDPTRDLTKAPALKPAQESYRQKRDTKLLRLLERFCRLAGMPNTQVSIDHKVRSFSKLGKEGAAITLNPDSLMDFSLRTGWGKGDGIPLEIVDLMVAAHESYRVRDFGDPSFFVEISSRPPRFVNARRFFNHVVDDTSIDLRLSEIPLFSRYFESYLYRIVEQDMRYLPCHIQFINTVRLKLFLPRSSPLVASEVQESISDLERGAASLQTLLCEVFDPRQGFAERHRRADAALFSRYEALLSQDFEKADPYLFIQKYDEQLFYGAVESPDPIELLKTKEDENSEYIGELFRVTDENLAKATLDSFLENSKLAEDKEDDGSPGLILPKSGTPDEDLEIAADTMLGYTACVNQWRAVIKDVSEIFLTLATPKEAIAVPRYRHISAHDGVRLNPHSTTGAHIQLITGRPQPIWQPVYKQIRHQELRFSGLDIYLLLDVSGSMGGENARYASAMSVCLTEGLQLARRRAEADPTQGTVDVRTQLLAFGAGWAELTPLCKVPSQSQRETAYFNLMHPSSNFTLVNGALRQVSSSARLCPERDVLCLIVSDGLFSDSLEAFKTVKDMPSNVYVGHIFIGDFSGIPITSHCEIIHSPKLLPKKLKALLEEQLILVARRSGQPI